MSRTRYAFEGDYVANPAPQDAEAIVACALIASNIPTEPPGEWFADPKLANPTPLNIDDDGRVFGHIATWHTNHIGLPFGTKPPRSRTNYSYFHTGTLRTTDGTDIPVGQLTLAGGHAGLSLSASDAVKHYDDTASGVADVHAGEDRHGIWVAGALRPGTTPDQIRVLRASAPSGDWRPINGRLELVACCQVNVPGFPVPRAHVASGYVTALVAAGAAALAEMRGPSIDERLERIERAVIANDAPTAVLSADQQDALARRRAELAARVRGPQQEKLTSLAASARARFADLTEEFDEAKLFADVGKDKLQEYAKKGWALPDEERGGRFPIASQDDLRKAVKAYGRADAGDKSKVRRHIMKRARGLGRTDLIPSSWKSASVEERFRHAREEFFAIQRNQATEQEFSEKYESLVAAGFLPPKVAPVKGGPAIPSNRLGFSRKGYTFKESNHPRATDGKFRATLARLKADVVDTENEPDLDEAVEELDKADKQSAQGDEQGAVDHAAKAIQVIDRVAEGTDNPNTKRTLRDGYTKLGETVGQLQLHRTEAYEGKLRFTDLSPDARGFVEEMVERLKASVSDEAFEAATEDLQDFLIGNDVWSAEEIQGALAKIMRYLMGDPDQDRKGNQLDKKDDD